MSNQNQQSQPPLVSSTRLLPWVSDLVAELKLDTFGLVDIQVSESAPTSVTYVGNDPVASYHPVALRQTLKLTVIFSSSKMSPQSSAPAESLTRWLHTMVYLRGGMCGSTVVLPDQSQWAVQSYDIAMDITQIPRIHLELVGLRIPEIKDLEKWVPVPPIEWPTVKPTRQQIFDGLEKLIRKGMANIQDMVTFETTGSITPVLMTQVEAEVIAQKQGRETKQKVERKDAFWRK